MTDPFLYARHGRLSLHASDVLPVHVRSALVRWIWPSTAPRIFADICGYLRLVSSDEHMYLLRGICMHYKIHNFHLILGLNYAYIFPGVGTASDSESIYLSLYICVCIYIYGCPVPKRQVCFYAPFSIERCWFYNEIASIQPGAIAAYGLGNAHGGSCVSYWRILISYWRILISHWEMAAFPLINVDFMIKTAWGLCCCWCTLAIELGYISGSGWALTPPGRCCGQVRCQSSSSMYIQNNDFSIRNCRHDMLRGGDDFVWDRPVSKDDEFRIKNEELRIKMMNLVLKNDRFCI